MLSNRIPRLDDLQASAPQVKTARGTSWQDMLPVTSARALAAAARLLQASFKPYEVKPRYPPLPSLVVQTGPRQHAMSARSGYTFLNSPLPCAAALASRTSNESQQHGLLKP